MAVLPHIPGYKTVGLLGKGGMGTVYLGIQESLKRKVAIKILKLSDSINKEIASRFEKEAKTAAMLLHSNIVQIFDTGKAGRYYYIVMEYLDDSLKDQIMKCHPKREIPPRKALGIVKEIIKALDYAHSKGVYHRDIKPGNIMFRFDGTPVLVDFGIAKALDFTTQMTRTGIILGTPWYMSPEQCNAQEVDGRSDIYSLGVVLFEMITGNTPYIADKMEILIHKHIHEPVPQLPQHLIIYQTLIDNMMAKDKGKRISNKEQFVQLLDRILTNPVRTTNTLRAPNFIKEKPIPFMPEIIPHPRSIIDKSLMKKFVLVVLPVIVVFILIFIILFRPGYEKPIQKLPGETNQPYKLFIVNDLFKEVSQYQLAYGLYKKDDLESLNEATETIKKLKMTIFTPEVKALEEKVSRRIKELEAEFKEHFLSAWELYKNKDYLKARESLLKAKKIKTTEDIIFIEKRIEEETQKAKKE